jgi:3-hydroxyisobutyrate dehydrogenase-like beta-hydroxyacid dehydrogenase
LLEICRVPSESTNNGVFTMSEESVGFIGLGAMGLPMATNLIAAGFTVRIWNRTASKAEPLVARGATLAATPGEVVASGGIAVTMLADDAAVEAVTMGDGGLAARLAPDGIHISMSTIAPATARALADYHATRGSTYIAAPVFGRPDAAEQRQLVVCTSGPPAAKTRARPILDAIGRAVFEYGDDPGAANVAKLCGNFLIASALEAMGEALALAEKNALDRAQLASMLGKTLFACPVYQRYGAMIADKQHMPAGFALSLGLKDLNLVLAAADQARVPMPLAGLVKQRLLSGLAKKRDEMDWSALALGILDDSGIE